jgi:hypothetical protein
MDYDASWSTLLYKIRNNGKPKMQAWVIGAADKEICA